MRSNCKLMDSWRFQLIFGGKAEAAEKDKIFRRGNKGTGHIYHLLFLERSTASPINSMRVYGVNPNAVRVQKMKPHLFFGDFAEKCYITSGQDCESVQ